MVIYKTTNLINGKIYVGKDCGRPLGYLGSGLYFLRALAKYGKENFKREILEICTITNICEREKYWIKFLKAQNLTIGYNIAAGGESGWLGMKRPKEACHKASETMKLFWKNHRHPMKGKHLSCETKKKMSSVRIGVNNGFFGKVHSEEVLKKISVACKRRRWLRFGERAPNFGKKQSEEWKQAILRGRQANPYIYSAAVKKVLSEQKLGEKNPCFGKIYSEEERRIMSDSVKRSWVRRHFIKLCA